MRSTQWGAVAAWSLTPLALAQPAARIYLETDAPGGLIHPNQRVRLRVMVDWTGGVQFAGTNVRLDVAGNAGSASGFTSIFPPVFFSLGAVNGGSVRHIDVASFAPVQMGGAVVSPFDEPTLPLVEFDWRAPDALHGSRINISLDNDGGRPGAFVFTSTSSTSWALADTTFEKYSFTVQPAPGGLGVAAIAAPWAMRRRR